MRAANRAGVVKVLRNCGWATRAELIERTGLSRATVSSIVGELSERGLVTQRVPSATGLRGRPVAEVALNRSAGTAIAVDIGVRHVAVAVGDLSRSILAERWVTTPRNHTAARGTKLVLDSIRDAVEQAGVDADDLVGAAISVAAPVATSGGRLAVPDVLPGWNGSVLAERVAERWGIPVVTENDANLGALGEVVHNPPAVDGDVLFVKIASRIGLGTARGSAIVRGRRGYAGEFGHVTARVNGLPCWCGRRGCLELYAGGDGMLQRLAGTGRVDTIARLLELSATCRDVRRVVADGASVLARALADLALVLDPARIVLGGELTALGHVLEDPIRRELETLPFGTPVELVVSPLGERASLVGALSLVLTEPTSFADRSQELVSRTPSVTVRTPSQPPLSVPLTSGAHV